MKAAFAIACAVVACTGGKGANDVFIAGGGNATWVTTSDGRVRVPLAADLKWEPPASSKEYLLRVRGEPGPSWVTVAEVTGVPKPLTLAACAEAHRAKIVVALTVSGVATTPPSLGDDVRRGEHVPRLHYALPLEPKAGDRPASALSYWTYFLDGARCLAVGVTTVVRAKIDDPQQPDPEELERHERVYALLFDGTTFTKP